MTYLVKVCLCKLVVIEEVIGAEGKVKLESRLALLKIGKADVGQEFQYLTAHQLCFSEILSAYLLIPIRDGVRDWRMVPQCSEPKFRHSINLLILPSGLVILDLSNPRALPFLFVFVVRVGVLASLNLYFSRLLLALDYCKPAVVEW